MYFGRNVIGITDLFPRNAHFALGGATIEKDDSAAAVAQSFRPHFQIAIFLDAMSFAPQLVLVDGDHLGIRENLFDFWLHGAHIVAGDQWRGEQCPETEMRAIFGNGHPTVAYFHHVRVVPVSRASECFQSDLQVQNVYHAVFAATAIRPFLLAGPFVADVAGGAPQIADAFAPQPRLGGAPFAHTEDNRPACG